MRKDAYVRAYVGLGANLGDRAATLAAAVRALDEVPGIAVKDVSRLYATRPVGPPGQPEFYNAVIAIEVGGREHAEERAVRLLRTLKGLESRFGRKPRERWGPRELDLDLLLFGGQRLHVADPPLTVPHPLARERLFVLAPLHDLAPTLRPAGWAETVDAAYQRQLVVEGGGAVRPVGVWSPAVRRWELLAEA
jgi:2-amino-4-hydroxy-6-hydroxymethyldihydropteridine diphosphokinase